MGKLVRDRIPEIIRLAGTTCTTWVLNDKDYAAALKAKLVEESQEAMAAEGDDLITELADLCEVMEAIATHYKLDWDTVRAVQAQRRQQRGSFCDRLWLATVAGKPLS